MMRPADAEKQAEIFRVLSSAVRLRILAFLAGGEWTVGEIEQRLGLKQPALSQQLAELRQSGLVATRRHAKSVYYKLADERAGLLMAALAAIFGGGVARQALADAFNLSTPAQTGRRTGEAAVFAKAGHQLRQ